MNQVPVDEFANGVFMLKKLARHVFREATKAGFTLIGVTDGRGRTKASALEESDLSLSSDAQLVLEFQRCKQGMTESVVLAASKSECISCVTYQGTGLVFTTLVANANSYIRQIGIQQQMSRKTF